MSERAQVVCKDCGMPVVVVFSDEGEIEQVFAVCGHVKVPPPTPNKESPDA